MSNVNKARLAAVVIAVVLMMRSLAALMPNQNRSRRKKQRARQRRHIKGARASNRRNTRRKLKGKGIPAAVLLKISHQIKGRRREKAVMMRRQLFLVPLTSILVAKNYQGPQLIGPRLHTPKSLS